MNVAEKRAFTVEYEGVVAVLKTKCGISEAFDRKTKNKPDNIIEVDVIWDTGAEGSAISKRVVQSLGLMRTGEAIVYHAGGGGDPVNTYSVYVYLPNNVIAYVPEATEGDLNGTDILIGMDIISQGDFAVTAPQGKTKFTFQFPSTHNLDFVKEQEQKVPINTPGRNDKCPCGSGKKYKHCCLK